MTDDEQAIEDHRQRHVALHKALDEIFADYIVHHPQDRKFLEVPIGDILRWSHQQTLKPTELKEE